MRPLQVAVPAQLESQKQAKCLVRLAWPYCIRAPQLGYAYRISPGVAEANKVARIRGFKERKGMEAIERKALLHTSDVSATSKVLSEKKYLSLFTTEPGQAPATRAI